MTLMTPITTTPATAIRHPRAERLAAFKELAGNIVAQAAEDLEFAAAIRVDIEAIMNSPGGWPTRAGMQIQAARRLIGLAVLAGELDRTTVCAVAPIINEMTRGGLTKGEKSADKIRSLGERLDAAIDIELHQIKIGIAYDRYA